MCKTGFAEKFIDFCNRYWQDNLSGSEITEYYKRNRIKDLKCYAEPYFKDILTSEITPEIIRNFLLHVSKLETRYYKKAQEKGIPYYKNRYLAMGTVRIIRTAVIRPLEFALENGLNCSSSNWSKESCLPKNHIRSGYFKGMVAPRDIFTSEELDKLTSSVWDDERAYMMFLLSRYTGMRNGELRGLQIKSIKPEYIDIETGYNSADGLKCTKNGTIRRFPIFKGLYLRLQAYISRLPLESMHQPEAFVFPSFRNTKIPVGSSFAITALDAQMKKLGIPKERSEGGIIVTRTFHSLRHCMDTYLTNSTKLGLASIARLMGHSPLMVQHNADHFNTELYKAAAISIAESHLWPEQYREPSFGHSSPDIHELLSSQLDKISQQLAILLSSVDSEKLKINREIF